MVKPTITVFATLAALVVADNCKTGLFYCGAGLLSKGNYYSQIVAALEADGQSTDSDHINSSLFHCTGGSNGDIDFQTFCGSGNCIDGGDGVSDYCA
ncbi:hypothetical protein V8F20_009856 [Naviculisporaceae sp. PSN 640]